MDLWFEEPNNNAVRFSCRVEDVLFRGKSEFQTVDVVETRAYGRMMLIDGLVMISDRDEFVYHEMIAHVPMLYHKAPKTIVVIGGGDGGTVRELLRYDSVEQIILCEIDAMVVDAAKKFFPKVAEGFDHPKVKVVIGDGIKYVTELPEGSVDVFLVDSTDPIGPGEGLFSKSFYRDVARVLRPGGIMACQSESPWYDQAVLGRISANVKAGFNHIRPIVGIIPTYPTGAWSWTIASADPINPEEIHWKNFDRFANELQYINRDLVKSIFYAVPSFYRQKLGL